MHQMHHRRRGANDVDETELFNQALAAAQAGQRAQAKRVLAELVNINPRHEQAWLRLAGVASRWAGLYEVTPDAHRSWARRRWQVFMWSRASRATALCTAPSAAC